MPGVVEGVGDEDGLEGLIVLVVGGVAAGFAHGGGVVRMARRERDDDLETVERHLQHEANTRS